jgi:hypothetical protein
LIRSILCYIQFELLLSKSYWFFSKYLSETIGEIKGKDGPYTPKNFIKIVDSSFGARLEAIVS